MTNAECVEALVVVLKDYIDQITVGEADAGGYNGSSISDVFGDVGLNSMANRMERSGVEWLFRFATEPRRLGLRYLKNNPRFLWKVTLQELRSLRSNGEMGTSR